MFIIVDNRLISGEFCDIFEQGKNIEQSPSYGLNKTKLLLNIEINFLFRSEVLFYLSQEMVGY